MFVQNFKLISFFRSNFYFYSILSLSANILSRLNLPVVSSTKPIMLLYLQNSYMRVKT